MCVFVCVCVYARPGQRWRTAQARPSFQPQSSISETRQMRNLSETDRQRTTVCDEAVCLTNQEKPSTVSIFSCVACKNELGS
jgi:hypothetical protein